MTACIEIAHAALHDIAREILAECARLNADDDIALEHFLMCENTYPTIDAIIIRANPTRNADMHDDIIRAIDETRVIDGHMSHDDFRATYDV